MGHFDVHVIGYLRVDGCHAPSWPVIVHDQVMAPHDSLILFHESADPHILFRGHCLADQRLQSIFGNADSGPHYHQGYADSYDSVNIDSRNPEK
ncbi:hypothetical protein SDC9_201395 [bioreactor metagenome]|uniref:Uncharacterized protein n=1 Tax=bioreactor metagenome TaxID=1076179 RepID=A0A645ITK5_9ZZZZ